MTIEPVTVKPIEPMPIKPIEPMPIKPIEPMPIKPIEPVTVKPIEPVTVKPIEPVTVKPIEPMQIKAIKPRVFANTATALFVINGIWRTYNSDNDLPAIKQSDHIFWQGKLWSNGRLLADPEELGDESLLYDLYHYFDGLADESICARELLDTPDCFL
jgi:hypothetical protein